MAYMPKEDKTELYTIKLEKQGIKWTKEKKQDIFFFMSGLPWIVFMEWLSCFYSK